MKNASEVAQVASKCEALSSNPSTTKKEKKKKSTMNFKLGTCG
jgi:hypothetical protein